MRAPQSSPEEAFRAFRARVEAQGGVVLESEWLGSNTPHRVRCGQGHEVTPRPSTVQQGHRFCRVCVLKKKIEDRQKVAFERFSDYLESIGAELLETEWRGSRASYRARCAEGHEGFAIPDTLPHSQIGFCRVCGVKSSADTRRILVRLAGRKSSKQGFTKIAKPTPQEAFAMFRARVKAQGGTVIENEWLGSNASHRIRCKVGHEVTIRPGTVQQGNGICRVCGAEKSIATRGVTAFEKFKTYLESIGAVLLEDEWLGARAPHRALCAEGHECTAIPTRLPNRQIGICRPCGVVRSVRSRKKRKSNPSDEPVVCQCCTFGNHDVRCDCDGSGCCHPEAYLEYNPAWGHGKEAV